MLSKGNNWKVFCINELFLPQFIQLQLENLIVVEKYFFNLLDYRSLFYGVSSTNGILFFVNSENLSKNLNGLIVCWQEIILRCYCLIYDWSDDLFILLITINWINWNWSNSNKTRLSIEIWYSNFIYFHFLNKIILYQSLILLIS